MNIVAGAAGVRSTSSLYIGGWGSWGSWGSWRS